MNVWLKRALIAVPLVVVLFFGAVLFYVNVIRDDPPDELGTDDLSELVAGTTTSTTTPATAAETAAETAAPTTAATTAATAPATDATVAATTDGDASTRYDGTWTATGESVFGYRVVEVLFGVDTEGVGRGSDITGELTIDATTVSSASFSVDVASIVSDDERRDGQFRGNIMNVAEFPTAEFVLTTPIELPSAPQPGSTVTATATGDLTLRGVTNEVTFDVTAEAGEDRFGVLGSIPIVFADYGIDNPSRPGITTEDHGLLEFILVFEPA